jgi:hypothetical protein
MFEMMVGYPPFYNEEQHITFQNIINWREHFVIPEEANLSKEACDFLKRLITDSEIRLGRNGAEEVKEHPFFKGIDWENIRNQRAPYIPSVGSEISNENFDNFDDEKNKAE